MGNVSSGFLKLRFEHNNRVLFITIYSEVIIQLYVADFHQTKLKDKEAASSLESFSWSRSKHGQKKKTFWRTHV